MASEKQNFAVSFLKMKIDDMTFAYKPLSVIEGTYDAESDTFFDESGIRYISMQEWGALESDELVFAFPFTWNDVVCQSEASMTPPNFTEFSYQYRQALEDYLFYSYMRIDGVDAFAIGKENYEIFKINPSINFYQCKKEMMTPSRSYTDVPSSVILPKKEAKVDITDSQTESKISPIAQTDSIVEKPIVKTDFTIQDLNEVYQYVTDRIMFQDEAVNKILHTIYRNLQYANRYEELHNNIIIQGDTGHGKTKMLELIAKSLDLPVYFCDITKYSKTGFVGRDISNIFHDLVRVANGDIARAEKGIIVFDEFDKIRRINGSPNASGDSVQHELLFLLNGSEIELTEPGSRGEAVPTGKFINTANITFIGDGAFAGMFDDVMKKRVGFGAEENTMRPSIKLAPEHLVKYGFDSQLIRRYPVLIQLTSLNAEKLFGIARDSKISPVVIYGKMLKDVHDVDLKYGDEELRAIAQKAEALKNGASGILSVVTEALDDALCEIEKNPGEYSTLSISSDTIDDSSKYVLTKKKGGMNIYGKLPIDNR